MLLGPSAWLGGFSPDHEQHLVRFTYPCRTASPQRFRISADGKLIRLTALQAAVEGNVTGVTRCCLASIVFVWMESFAREWLSDSYTRRRLKISQLAIKTAALFIAVQLQTVFEL